MPEGVGCANETGAAAVRGTSRAAPLLLVFATLISACRASPDPVARLSSALGTIELAHGEYRVLELAFETLDELPEFADDPRVFVHLAAEDGEIVRTFDHPLADPWWPKSRLDDRFLLLLSLLAPPLQPGEYRLLAGLYDLDGGKYATRSELPPAGKRTWEIGRFRVRSNPAKSPEVELEGAWQPPAADRDRQVMGARDLRASERGSVRLAGHGTGGDLLLRFDLPALAIHGPEIVLQEGATELLAHAEVGCTGARYELRGSGAIDLVIPVPPPDAGGACTIELGSNFVVHPSDGSPPSSLRLTAIGWNPRPASPPPGPGEGLR